MHDIHAANAILKIVLAEAKKSNLKKINIITIELGSIIEHGEEINPLNLKFNLRLLAKNTPAEHARIEISARGGSAFGGKKTSGPTWKLVSIDGD